MAKLKMYKFTAGPTKTPIEDGSHFFSLFVMAASMQKARELIKASNAVLRKCNPKSLRLKVSWTRCCVTVWPENTVVLA